ncbi:S-layer homology domain-containing protein [Paenibacillus doosanensis]|uniref:NHL domain-containing protein n=1 Tax=Paenibacillus doosanensis TaxID=1229154 RepID=UPI002180182D|nr:S-layer homology domain-containing protein [Paenibacillus doosanensis]MCS7460764.1 S-layer homology domain-containing protein [Paenibacillus doosanensis]
MRKQVKKRIAIMLAFLLIMSLLPEWLGGKAHAAAIYIIDTVAGTGTGGFSGDGGPAIAAQLKNPYGVAVDSSGNLYIVDYENSRIRKVDASGTISTVAGTGSAGFSGDGGPATAAELNYPMGVAVDNSGNLYISDTVNCRIRKVDASGTISTVAGTGVFGYSGDGGSAISAKLSYPSGMTTDKDGNVYFVDQSNHRIRKIDASGTISTVAGTGIAGDSGDGGSAASAELRSPTGVALDDSGNLYIADFTNNRIRKVDRSGIISTVAGTGSVGYSGDGGPATSAQLTYPSGVAVDRYGQLYIADAGNYSIRKVDASGTISTIAGTGIQGYSGDGGAASSAQFFNPFSLAAANNGELYIADVFNQRVRKLSLGAQTVEAFADSHNPEVGANVNNTITIFVKNANGLTDTTFSGEHEVTISGYLQAPDNSYGSLNGTALSASPNTIGVMFNNGAATVKLKLNKAGEQTIALSVADVASPQTNPLIITPRAGSAASMELTTDIKAPASNGGAFAQQPVVTLLDAYGNKSAGDNSTVVTVKKKDSGAWNLTGTTTAAASSGSVTFTDLGATSGAAVTGAQLRFEADGLPPIESTTVALPWEAPKVARVGDLPVGTKIRDNREWDYFTAGSIEAGLSDAEVYKTAPINWVLVDKDKYERGTSLFISEEIVAETNEVIKEGMMKPWSLSPVRGWLRESFYPAFSATFRNAISITSYPNLSEGDGLQEETFFILAASELISVYGEDQYVIPYFKNANDRKASGNESEYYWTRSQNSLFSYLYYLVNNASGDLRIKSGNLKVGVRPVVNLKADTLVEGPFIDSVNGSAYYQLVQEPYEAIAELEASEVQAGSEVNIRFEVHDEDGSINTSFNEPTEVTLKGYEAAPDGTAGSFGGETLSGAQKTIQVQFRDGVATVPLVLHAALQQTLHFHIKGLLEPNVEPVVVQPEPRAAKNLKLQADSTGFDDRTGLFDPQPIVWLVDDYGNLSKDNATPVRVSKMGIENWRLTGTTIKIAENGMAIFEDLGASYTGDVRGARLQFDALGLNSTVTSSMIRLPALAIIGSINGSFDKNPAKQADMSTIVTLNGNTLISIKNGSDELTADEDYTLVGNTLTIRKEYLAQQSVGSLTLTFAFSAGSPQTLNIPIVDTTPQEQDTGVPQWPDGSKLAASDITQTSMRLSWPTATDNVGVIGYRIFMNGAERMTVSGSVYETIIDGLSADTTYTFRVTAYDTAGNESAPGLSIKVTTLPKQPEPDIETPTWSEDSELIVSSVTRTSVQLSWPKATDNVGVTGYRIYMNGTEHMTVSGSIYGTSIDSLSANTMYTFKVTAYDAAGNESEFGLSRTVRTLARSSSSSGGGLSSNASLKTFEIWTDGQRLSLTPSFTMETYSYRARTEAKQIEVRATVDHTAAKATWQEQTISDGIQIELEEGENIIPITVQAEDGSRRTYTLVIEKVVPEPQEPKPSAASLIDIEGHWAENDINRAAANGIVNGYPDGAFKPNNPVTRAEFTVMLAGALKLKGEVSSLTFTDNDQIGRWAITAVEQVVQAGIVNGYEDGSFRPNDYISRAEMAAMIARALKKEINANAFTDFADDEAIPQWAKGAIKATRTLGIVDGRGSNQFAPNETATRGEATVMLLRMLKQLESDRAG